MAVKGTASALRLALLVLLVACTSRGALSASSSARAGLSAGPNTAHVVSGRKLGTSGEASLELAARQSLFDYAVQQGLVILQAKVGDIVVADISTEVDIPVIGALNLGVSNITIQHLSIAPEDVALQIESGFYHLRVNNVMTDVAFNWAWSKSPISGSGYGVLNLTGGGLDMIFLVTNQESGQPEVQVVSTGLSFDSIDLDIHSHSVDWLYQAIMYLFSGTIKHQIENEIEGALRHDVPSAINELLATLPAALSVQGLPFQMVFTYALYTLSYVMVKGYGQVDLPAALASANLAAAAPQTPGGRLAAAIREAMEQGALGSTECPFPATALSVSPIEVSGDGHMASLYIHQSILNCLFWGLHGAGVLSVTVSDGDIPQVRLITDVFMGLMPELPKLYPHRSLQLHMQTDAAPQVTFSRDSNVTLTCRYTTVVRVLNATGDGATVEAATLSAEISVGAYVDWDANDIQKVNVNYTVVSSICAVNTNGWNMMLPWLLKQAAPKLTLHALMDQYVVTPVNPYLGLNRTKCSPYDGWYGLSSDVVLKKLPTGPSVLPVPTPGGSPATGGGSGDASGGSSTPSPQDEDDDQAVRKWPKTVQRVHAERAFV